MFLGFHRNVPPMGSPVVEMWAQSPTLMNRAAAGKVALVGDHKCIDRADVVANGDVIAPVLKFLGTRVTVHTIKEHTEQFLAYARPKGKAPLSSVLV